MTKLATSEAARIVGDVADQTGVPVSDILGESRKRKIVRARWQVYLAMIEAGAGYAGTGRLMQRHHTTIMHGVRTARAQQERVHG